MRHSLLQVRPDNGEHRVVCTCGWALTHPSRPIAMAAQIDHAVSMFALSENELAREQVTRP